MVLLLAGCATAPRASDPFTVQTVVYSMPGGEPLSADVYLPQSAGLRPALLVLHSGSWQRGSSKRMTKVSEELARYGFVVINANYRLAPAHKYPAQLEDVRAAVKWIRDNAKELSADPRRIGILGYSAGGHLALMSAFTQGTGVHSVQAVVSAGAPTDLTSLFDVSPLRDFIGRTREEAPELYRLASPIEYAGPKSPPALLIHGESDFIVPHDQAVRLFTKLSQAGAPVEHFWMPMGHVRTTAGLNKEEVARAAEFFARRLGMTSASR